MKQIGQQILSPTGSFDFPEQSIITSLSIYAPPGTTFYINDENSQIVIGGTGIFQISDVNIQSFNLKSAPEATTVAIPLPEAITTQPIIIDYVYEGGNTNG